MHNACKRPLQKLCRTASARFFRSFHASKSAATLATDFVDSSTTVSLTDHEDDDVLHDDTHHIDDDDDSSSCCSFENASVESTPKPGSVHFPRHLTTEVHQVENCFYMQPQDRAATWYSRYELSASKRQHKMTLLVLQKEQHKHLRRGIVDAFDGVQLMADSGFDDLMDLQLLADNLMGSDGPDTSVTAMLTEWCKSDVQGHACRGLEKHVLRKLREGESRVSRQVVVNANHHNDSSHQQPQEPDQVAERYRNMSRYATIYAESMARADAAAAQAVHQEGETC